MAEANDELGSQSSALSRRDLVKRGAAGAFAVSMFGGLAERAHPVAGPMKFKNKQLSGDLRILQWAHFVPDPIHYRKSFWFNAGIAPTTWDNVRKAAAALKKAGHPVGLGMSNELDSNMFLMALLYCYGSALQTEDGKPNINNKGTIE